MRGAAQRTGVLARRSAAFGLSRATMAAGAALALAAGVAIAGCGSVEEDPVEDRQPIREVMAEHREEWMAHPHVTGMGLGQCDGQPCIVLYLLRRSPQVEEALPDSAGGYPVRLEVTGRVEPRDPPPGPDGPSRDA